MKVASLAKDCLPLPPTPTNRAWPPIKKYKTHKKISSGYSGYLKTCQMVGWFYSWVGLSPIELSVDKCYTKDLFHLWTKIFVCFETNKFWPLNFNFGLNVQYLTSLFNDSVDSWSMFCSIPKHHKRHWSFWYSVIFLQVMFHGFCQKTDIRYFIINLEDENTIRNHQ